MSALKSNPHRSCSPIPARLVQLVQSIGACAVGTSHPKPGRACAPDGLLDDQKFWDERYGFSAPSLAISIFNYFQIFS